jgi:hypothetical protein
LAISAGDDSSFVSDILKTISSDETWGNRSENQPGFETFLSVWYAYI